ncbi:MAG TPA: DUF2259 domain-containing protein [Myxococcales bacterium]|jgi:hypothetical protein|nr:DUF2259 domain-containing protein [Myxococcales bacterium]
MLLALLLAAAAAGPVEVVGFSPDDKYVAFIEHGVAEGSGYPWARLRVMDVGRSADAAAPVSITLDSGKDTDTEEGAVRKARDAAEAARVKLGIASWAAPRIIQTDDKGELSDHTGAPIGTLEIKERAGKGKCEEPFRPLLLSLVIHWLDDDKPARVAEEKKPPKDRSCAGECALGGVFAHGKVALVLAKCTVQGFEGPSTHYSPYTARLPYGLDEPLPAQ